MKKNLAGFRVQTMQADNDGNVSNWDSTVIMWELSLQWHYTFAPKQIKIFIKETGILDEAGLFILDNRIASTISEQLWLFSAALGLHLSALFRLCSRTSYLY